MDRRRCGNNSVGEEWGKSGERTNLRALGQHHIFGMSSHLLCFCPQVTIVVTLPYSLFFAISSSAIHYSMTTLHGQSYDAGPHLLRDVWVVTAIGIVVLILRVIAKLRIRKLGWDDALMTLAMVSNRSTLFIFSICISRMPNARDVYMLGPLLTPDIRVF